MVETPNVISSSTSNSTFTVSSAVNTVTLFVKVVNCTGQLVIEQCEVDTYVMLGCYFPSDSISCIVSIGQSVELIALS